MAVFLSAFSSLTKYLALLVLLACVSPLYAAVETYDFNTDLERKRYNTFIDELRCPKCQNQNLAGSDSPIAADLRRELHRMVQAGQSDTQIVDFMVARYGEFVLYRPRMTLKTIVLWLAPIAFLIFGLAWVIWVVRRQKNHLSATELTQDEYQALSSLLEKEPNQLTSRQRQNIALYQQRLDELNAQKDAQSIGSDDYSVLILEALRNVLNDFQSLDEPKSPSKAHGLSWPIGLIVISAILLPIAVWGIYQKLGARPDLEIHQKITDFYALRESTNDQQKLLGAQNELVSLMEERLDSAPDKLNYAGLLAQVYTQRGEHLKAAEFYSLLAKAEPENANIQAQLAQSLYFAYDRKMEPPVIKAMDKTLSIDPKNPIVLGLQGIHFFNQKQYEQALRAWQTLLMVLPQGSQQAKLIERGIMQAQLKLAVQDPTPKTRDKDNSGKQIRVSVSLPKPVLSAQGVTPMTTVFVMAKALIGPPMPLAIQRLRVTDLPVTVVLDDSTAMMPEMKLSAFDEVEVIVRVSRSGSTSAQKGDFEARSGKITLSDKPVSISLSPNTVIP